jgi:hypothetical protein
MSFGEVVLVLETTLLVLLNVPLTFVAIKELLQGVSLRKVLPAAK